MRKARLTILMIGLLMALMVGRSYAETTVFAIDGVPTYEGTIATTTSSIGFDASYIVVTDALGRGIFPKAALIVVETAAINMTLAGGTPTAAAGTNVGIPIEAGQSYVIKGADAVRAFRCINRVASSGAKVKYIIFF